MKISQLKKKYPKGFDKFINKMKLDYDYLESEDIRCYWKEITDFMDKQGIIYTVKFDNITNELIPEIFEKCLDGYFFKYELGRFKKNDKAETKAICKEFEILENRLKEQK